MRTIPPLIAAIVALGVSIPAHSAVTCVLNKDTKKFESSAAKQSKSQKIEPTPCDSDAAKQTLEGIQQAINTAGSKLVNPTVIVNADKLPLPAPKVDGISRVKETPDEMAIPGTPAKPAVAKVTPPPPPADKVKRDWVLRADTHNTLEEALEEFAARVDYELVYEAREFSLNLKRDITVARGADFWEALRVLGETYRKSDGAFQVLPTEFKQIVILPMGQNTAAAR